MESLRFEFHFMDSWKASVSQTLMHSLRLIFDIVAGAGKSVLWCGNLRVNMFRELIESASSTIIENIDEMRKCGLASLAFFYCDFRDDAKKDRRGLLSSLLVQLCEQSDSYCDILSDFYLAHRQGCQHPGDEALLQCIIRMLKLSGGVPVFIVLDALDELPNATGMPSPRDEVINFVEELVGLYIPKLRICVTSRPEADLQLVLDQLSFRSISLHSEGGQIQDIAEYIKSVVYTDPMMRRWKAADKELVIDVLTKKANGMYVIKINTTIPHLPDTRHVPQVPLGVLSAPLPPPLHPSTYSAGSRRTTGYPR
jgi:hypothetical protein